MIVDPLFCFQTHHGQEQVSKSTQAMDQKGHRTRCSPSEVAKTYKDLGDQKRTLVHEIGFGVLAENMSNYNFSNLIMMELADSFHIPDSTIRTNVGKFKIDATKVGHAFGLNAQGGLYRHKVIKKQVTAAQYEVIESFRKKTLADLRDMMYTIPLDSEENITKFKRAFILYVQKAVLCPNNSNPLSPKILPTILDARRKNTKHIDGCVFALLIIYFQETKFGQEFELPDAQPPWVVYWKNQMLKERIEYEFKDPAGLARQARNRTPTRKQSKAPPKIKLPQIKKQITETNLVKSLQIEGPKGKKILGKRKQMEEEEETDSSEYESESASEPELESESDSDPDSERTIYEDEAIDEDEPIPEKEDQRERHENLNANAVPSANQPIVEEDNAANEDVVQQPHQNAEEDNNAAAATDAIVGPSSQLTANLSGDITPLGDSEIQDKDVNPSPVPTATRDIVPESEARDTASVVGAAIEDEGVEEEGTQTDNTLEHTQDGDSEIVYASYEDPPTSVEEETTLTNLVQNITTQQHDHDAAVVHFPVEKDPPTRIEKEISFANIVQNITTQQHNDVLEDIQHGDAAIVEKEIALTPLFQNIPTQQHNDVLEDIQHGDTAIVEKEIALTPLFRNITTEEHMPQEKQLEESVSGPELTLKDLALKG
ncbi:hypothetical protein PIB30_079453 [Stylosanthes scabra]|uniref:Uncharacterized protein n=1 Tax=Stylosanthes scabra TaxID=79078 RepID=A0ABU6RRC6_9FABA|nr:hypothetical protein [Stylosanthes scabra]